MSRDTKTIIAVILFVAVLLVAVGFAAISNITLNIEGTAQAQASGENFSVKFATGNPTTDGAGTITATRTDDTHATLDVTGLSAKGEKATATYTIQNTSVDLSAELSAVASNDNEEYFKVTYAFKNDETTPVIAKGATTEITVTVELMKTPVDESTENLDATIGVAITAKPVQP